MRLRVEPARMRELSEAAYTVLVRLRAGWVLRGKLGRRDMPVFWMERKRDDARATVHLGVVRALHARGLVSRVEPGLYGLTDAGRAAAEVKT